MRTAVERWTWDFYCSESIYIFNAVSAVFRHAVRTRKLYALVETGQRKIVSYCFTGIFHIANLLIPPFSYVYDYMTKSTKIVLLEMSMRQLSVISRKRLSVTVSGPMSQTVNKFRNTYCLSKRVKTFHQIVFVQPHIDHRNKTGQVTL